MSTVVGDITLLVKGDNSDFKKSITDSMKAIGNLRKDLAKSFIIPKIKVPSINTKGVITQLNSIKNAIPKLTFPKLTIDIKGVIAQLNSIKNAIPKLTFPKLTIDIKGVIAQLNKLKTAFKPFTKIVNPKITINVTSALAAIKSVANALAKLPSSKNIKVTGSQSIKQTVTSTASTATRVPTPPKPPRDRSGESAVSRKQPFNIDRNLVGVNSSVLAKFVGVGELVQFIKQITGEAVRSSVALTEAVSKLKDPLVKIIASFGELLLKTPVISQLFNATVTGLNNVSNFLDNLNTKGLGTAIGENPKTAAGVGAVGVGIAVLAGNAITNIMKSFIEKQKQSYLDIAKHIKGLFDGARDLALLSGKTLARALKAGDAAVDVFFMSLGSLQTVLLQTRLNLAMLIQGMLALDFSMMWSGIYGIFNTFTVTMDLLATKMGMTTIATGSFRLSLTSLGATMTGLTTVQIPRLIAAIRGLTFAGVIASITTAWAFLGGLVTTVVGWFSALTVALSGLLAITGISALIAEIFVITKAINDFYNEFANLTGVDRGFLSGIWDGVKSVVNFLNIFKNIDFSFDFKIDTDFTGVGDRLSEMIADWARDIFEWSMNLEIMIRKVFSKLGIPSDVTDKVTEWINSWFVPTTDALSNLVGMLAESNLGKNVEDALKSTANFINSGVDSISGFFEDFGTAISNITDGFFKSLKQANNDLSNYFFDTVFAGKEKREMEANNAEAVQIPETLKQARERRKRIDSGEGFGAGFEAEGFKLEIPTIPLTGLDLDAEMKRLKAAVKAWFETPEQKFARMKAEQLGVSSDGLTPITTMEELQAKWAAEAEAALDLIPEINTTFRDMMDAMSEQVKTMSAEELKQFGVNAQSIMGVMNSVGMPVEGILGNLKSMGMNVDGFMSGLKNLPKAIGNMTPSDNRGTPQARQGSVEAYRILMSREDENKKIAANTKGMLDVWKDIQTNGLKLDVAVADW